ncbi:hypothetical protein RND81_03G110200 [Saponaria officinalis]|uniref:Uncharacterized protein n=1 Tax=Saponaria officinalis TaxID=3572 RepID=A0AAW1M6P6_SAPOF
MDPFSQIQLTEKEFYSFHNIDRQLFIRLVFILRREPYEAMQAIAFWLWLERLHRVNCVHAILSYPDHIIETVFQETITALRAAESDKFQALDDVNDLPILQNLVGREKQRINLSYFHERRIGVIVGVSSFVQQVCLRAFNDLIKIILRNYNLGLPPYNYDTTSNFNYNPLRNINSNINNNINININSGGNVGLGHGSFMVGDFSVPLKNQFNFPSINPSFINHDGASTSNNTNTLNNYFSPESQINHLGEILACMDINDDHQSKEVVVIPPRERTIFLTFSKGYPISEPELRDFLFRTFGDIIENLYMQDVDGNEQPLYAKLIVRNGKAMQEVLGSEGKAKFSINGRHVWARKYVRKNATSPPSSPN